MEKNRLENTTENTQEALDPREADLRTLKDLELLLVGGGGDDTSGW